LVTGFLFAVAMWQCWSSGGGVDVRKPFDANCYVDLGQRCCDGLFFNAIERLRLAAHLIRSQEYGVYDGLRQPGGLLCFHSVGCSKICKQIIAGLQ